jgi:2-polyprenyl-3-methyl-5-hydroxy-6-metoxy-1,4-benzoquinol methylase
MDKQTQQYLLGIVKRNYEEIAADFDTTRKKYLWLELIKLTAPVKDGDRILDVGCGNGRLLQAFGEKKIKYVGVDGSKELIKAAKSNYELRITNYEFKNVDVLELNKIPEKDFDYIFYIAVLHHLPGDELRIKALEQVKNKINNNGKIIITVWNLWSRRKFLRLIFKFGWLKLSGRNKMDFGDILFDWKNNKGEQVSRRYYHAFTKNELKKLAVRSGFKIEKLYKDKYNYYLVLEK